MRPVSRASTIAAACAVGTVGVAGIVWWREGSYLGPLTADFTLGCALAIALGEGVRTTVGRRSTAPISLAAGLSLTMTPVVGPQGRLLGTAALVLVVAASMALGVLARYASTRPVHMIDVVARLFAVTATSLVVRDLPVQGRTVLEWTTDPGVPRWGVALCLAVLSAAGVALDAVLRATARSQVIHAPLRVMLADDLGGGGGLSLSVAATGPLVVLARPVVGTWAIPLCLVPLVLAQFALRRHAVVVRTYRQTIGTLSRLTDVAGYTTAGHARRVAATSLGVGRDLGLSERDLTSLEYAALLHDLGQVALRVPIPGGATVLAAPSDQQRIADDGATIVRRTGVLDDVAFLLQRQTTPFRQVREFDEDLPVAARIIKVVNAYDDLTGGQRDRRASAAAMERIHLGLGYEYDPVVVAALQRVLARRAGTL